VSSFLTEYEEEIDFSQEEIKYLENFLADWGLLSDLALSDLVLWIPTWHQKGYFAVSQIRPATVPSNVPEDLVGQFLAAGRNNLIDQALASKKIISNVTNSNSKNSAVIPIVIEDRVIGLIERTWLADGRGGRMEKVYLAAADSLFKMLEQGNFLLLSQSQKINEAPRVGDGLIELDALGNVIFASPNAQSAFRRLGFNQDLIDQKFSKICSRLVKKPGLADESLTLVTSGKISGAIELENKLATITLRTLPLIKDKMQVGGLIFVHDVTLIRKKEKALLGKEATIREVHHRVKNNLQTVGALLRLQARRSKSDEVKKSLLEADQRINTIAIVHEYLSHSNEENINFDEILKKIIFMLSEINTSFEKTEENKIVLSGLAGNLTSQIAIPLAMAISELLQNSFQHGQPAELPVEIIIEKNDNDLHIQIKDYGPGLLDINQKPESLGLDIVKTLVQEELHGVLEFNKNQPQGLLVSVKVPLDLN
jgi:two-component system, sensor histidine kinase PdtaS